MSFLPYRGAKDRAAGVFKDRGAVRRCKSRALNVFEPKEKVKNANFSNWILISSTPTCMHNLYHISISCVFWDSFTLFPPVCVVVLLSSQQMVPPPSLSGPVTICYTWVTTSITPTLCETAAPSHVCLWDLFALSLFLTLHIFCCALW